MIKKIMTISAILSATYVSADIADFARYQKTVKAVESMTMSADNRKLAQQYGLSLVNVGWEDTGRGKNSSLGPNISDVTIQAHSVNERGEVTPVSMPIVRYPNFDDKSADISPDKFYVSVGNEKGLPLKQITLTEYLGDLDQYLSDVNSWSTTATDEDEDGNKTERKIERNLLSPRDSHVLVSAQVAYLPVPKNGMAEFNPVIFNYQSAKESPAVLTILATREGTSATIIDNTRDAFESKSYRMGQRLFYNKNGQRASLTATRKSEFLEKNPELPVKQTVGANGESGLNMVLLIQVPLKHKSRGFLGGGPLMLESVMMTKAVDVDDAVIGHGKVEGPFTEMDGLAIERDERFPIRVTVQFYKATNSGLLTEQMVEESKRTIDKVYANVDYVGSLVTGGKTLRPTDHDVQWCMDRPWWPIYFATNPVVALEEDSPLAISGEREMVELLENTYPLGVFWRYICEGPIYFQNAVKYALENN